MFGILGDTGSFVTFSLVFLSLTSMGYWIYKPAGFAPASRGEEDIEQLQSRDQLYGFAKIHPNPMWTTTPDGKVTWQNDACTGSLTTLFETSLSWSTAGQTQGRTHTNEETPNWFDLSATHHDGQIVWVATPANGEVRAENARIEFVQTLSKTFAQLSTGLAIFDKDRSLALFNPALLELTGLPFERLSQRPTLATFLDTLRSKGLLPEPRDYCDWRDKIAKLEAAAESGSYCEVWEVAEGVSYRVTGRPHPGGAIAFLIEDISQEVSRTRAVREELNLFADIFNSVGTYCAVFDETGSKLMSNEAFDDYWGLVEEDKNTSIIECLKTWQRATMPDPAWGDLRDFIKLTENRAEWSTVLHKISGRQIVMRCIPLLNRLTLVEFCEDQLVQTTRPALQAHG